MSERQASVLRAVVTAYIGEAAPIGSATLSHLLPVTLSAASIRNVLSELSEAGLVEKPHSSAGRVPTEKGLRVFVDELLAPSDLPAAERRDITYSLGDAEGEGVVHVASLLLSEHTRQLGFVVTPSLDRIVLRHVSLVELSSERLLAVLVSQSGAAYQRIVEVEDSIARRDLDAIARLLNDRVVGRTLQEVREALDAEARSQRSQADRLLLRALALGAVALTPEAGEAVDVVIETRLMLLEQPEFRDPRRLRDLFRAVETKERLLEVLDRVLEGDRPSVAFGDELDEPALRRCALVAAPYGSSGAPLGALGVIGPSRMDYGRIIPLVEFLSEVITGRLQA